MSPTSPDAAEPGRQILIVDDEVAIRRLVRRVLEEAGFRVHEATNGAEALALILSSATSLDAVVSDIVMPSLNGMQLTERVSAVHPDLPVVLMTGYHAGQLADLGIAAPCGLLAKPFTPDQLLAEIRRCLRTRT